MCLINGGFFMKHNFILIISLLSFVFAGENTTKIKVDGMQCSYSCAGKVQSVVQKIDGVKESSVDFAKGMATITFDEDKVNRTDIIKYLKKNTNYSICLLYTSPSPRDVRSSRMPSSA